MALKVMARALLWAAVGLVAGTTLSEGQMQEPRQSLERGIRLYRLGEFGRAEAALLTALDHAERAEDRRMEGLAHGALGSTYRAMRRLEEAERHLLQAIVAHDEVRHHFNRAITRITLANVRVERGDVIGATSAVDQAAEIVESLREKRGLDVALREVRLRLSKMDCGV